jgi:hypothetical protein
MFILCRGRDYDVMYKELLTCDLKIYSSLSGRTRTSWLKLWGCLFWWLPWLCRDGKCECGSVACIIRECIKRWNDLITSYMKNDATEQFGCTCSAPTLLYNHIAPSHWITQCPIITSTVRPRNQSTLSSCLIYPEDCDCSVHLDMFQQTWQNPETSSYTLDIYYKHQRTGTSWINS